MKIMYLTAEGFDSPNPNNQLAMTMIDDFLTADIGVYLVQSHKKGIYPDIPDIFLNRDGFTYDIIDRPVIDKTNFIRRYLDELSYLWRAKNVWKRKKADIDIVLLQSNPTSVFYIWLLRKILRKPIIYSVFDIFPGSAYDIGVIRQRWICRILNTIQKLAYRWSDKIVVPGEDMVDNLVSMGVESQKISVIANWFDDRSVSEVLPENNRFFKENDIHDDKFIVQFAGTLGYVLDYHTILDVAELLRNEDSIIFHIIGDGNQKEVIYQEIAQRQLSNIKTYPWQRVDIIQDVYSGCDACLIPLKDGVIGTGFPSKAALLMACHRAVIVSALENTKYFKMIQDNDIGIAVPSGHPEKLADAIRYLRDHPQRILEIEDNAQAFSKKYYSRSYNTAKFISLFHELEGRRDDHV